MGHAGFMSSANPENTPRTHGALTPAEMAVRTGVSVDTLRYYERESLLRPVARDASGHRRYSADDVAWVQVLRCLRDTDMSIEQLRRYCEMGEQGDHTVSARLAMLREHRNTVVQRMAALEASLKLIDHKIDFYESTVAGEGEE